MSARPATLDQGPGGSAPRRKQGLARLRHAGKQLLILLPLGVLVVWTVLPVLVTISISFKSPPAVYAQPQLIPVEPTVQAYRDIIGSDGFQASFLNSLIIGIGTALLTLVLSVPAAYAFARYRFRGRAFLLLFALLPRLIPGLGLIVPLYRIAVAIGAMDNRLMLVIVFTGTLLPLSVWLLVGFFQQIPRELEEAANVDGTNMFDRIRYVVLPLSVPALITIGVLAFRQAWQEFDLVLALTRSSAARTLPYELFLMQDSVGFANNPGLAAFAVLTLVPFIFVYLRLERYVVGGITSGAIK